MKFGVLGTGMVGSAIARRLHKLGHDVMVGTRSPGRADLPLPSGTYAEAAAHGEWIVNALPGEPAVDYLAQCDIAGKILIDISNPLDFSKGFPPSLSVSNTDSLGEIIQRTFPAAHVVKTLNTVTASVMVEPGRVPGRHTVFVSGNDKPAKGKVMDLLRSFGWQSIVDLGDITTARGTEQMLPLWVRLYSVLGTGEFNFAVMTKQAAEEGAPLSTA